MILLQKSHLTITMEGELEKDREEANQQSFSSRWVR